MVTIFHESLAITPVELKIHGQIKSVALPRAYKWIFFGALMKGNFFYLFEKEIVLSQTDANSVI